MRLVAGRVTQDKGLGQACLGEGKPLGVVPQTDAGVTEFNIASSGEVAPSGPGLAGKFAEFAETVVGPISEL